jgi:hypothetical protein
VRITGGAPKVEISTTNRKDHGPRRSRPGAGDGRGHRAWPRHRCAPAQPRARSGSSCRPGSQAGPTNDGRGTLKTRSQDVWSTRKGGHKARPDRPEEGEHQSLRPVDHPTILILEATPPGTPRCSPLGPQAADLNRAPRQGCSLPASASLGMPPSRPSGGGPSLRREWANRRAPTLALDLLADHRRIHRRGAPCPRFRTPDRQGPGCRRAGLVHTLPGSLGPRGTCQPD